MIITCMTDTRGTTPMYVNHSIVVIDLLTMYFGNEVCIFVFICIHESWNQSRSGELIWMIKSDRFSLKNHEKYNDF